mgnify:CR=1 FL=1
MTRDQIQLDLKLKLKLKLKQTNKLGITIAGVPWFNYYFIKIMKQNYGQQIIHTYWSINKFNNQNKREKNTL